MYHFLNNLYTTTKLTYIIPHYYLNDNNSGVESNTHFNLFSPTNTEIQGCKQYLAIYKP